MYLFYQIGRYALFLKKIFNKPERMRVYMRQLVFEMDSLGLKSIWIVAVISIFVGAVITLQTAYGMENPFLPMYLIGLTTRDTMLLEFSSTILCLILAGKIGSNVASEIGTMRVTEQIDALEVMGVNSATYLVLPKIVALQLVIPFLVILSIFIGIFGGWLSGVFSGVITTQEYIVGIQYAFDPYYVTYTLIKAEVFAFIITSIASYYGYYTDGGALDVGISSTKAVVTSSVTILLFNVILTQLLLT